MDAGILEDVLWHIHNWFEREQIPVSTCCIDDGSLPTSITDQMLDGQWYRIEGSYLNDGLHQHPDTSLSDETFNGTVTLLAIPSALLLVVEDIEDWIDRYNAAADYVAQSASKGAYQSESFGGYTYSLRSDLASNTASGGSTGLTGWQAEFASRLNPWRKIA